MNMHKPNIGVIIQARMGSTRLPRKVLKNLDNDITILGFLLKRLKLCKNVDEIIIATTPDMENKKIIELAKKNKIGYFIGSEKNVLERYYQCAKENNLDIIIRITSDCPFIDPKMVDEIIKFYFENDYDYIRNNFNTNFPRGMDTEIFNFKILEKVYNLADNEKDKEHVTYYIYSHSDDFRICSFNYQDLEKIEELRLTIDEIDDLKMCRELYKLLKNKGKFVKFSIYDIINIIKENPELLEINQDVKQKEI